ncbi:MAG: translation elongation factor [Chthonomonadaceae bacterium]|nr:translation elongation factor [Chthonomonadaceae bacterium]
MRCGALHRTDNTTFGGMEEMKLNENTYRGEARVIRRHGGPGMYGHCVLEVEATGIGSGFVFENGVVGGAIPGSYIPDIKTGVEDAMRCGILAGFPVVDVKVTVVDGSYHEVDSNSLAFRQAGAQAFKDACTRAPLVILEPIAELEVSTPDEYIGAVMGDINRRRGQVQDTDGTTVRALVPLAETFGYASDLRGMTQGRAHFTLTPKTYAEVPMSIQEQLVAR